MFATIVCAVGFAAPFAHAPAGSVEEGATLRISGAMARDAHVVVHFRAAGSREAAPAYTAAEPLRTEAGAFVFELSGAKVAPPGIEYYVTADDAPVFASADDPYYVTVVATPESILASSALRAHGGRRSLARVAFESVDFGSRPLEGGGASADRYFRIEGDYAYSLYRTIYSIRIGGGLVRSAAGADAVAPGLDYGYAEVRWRLSESIFIDTRGVLGADAQGFQPGAGAAVLLGKPEGVYVALGGEVIGRAGSMGFLKLRWDTIPSVPMSARLELSDFPASDRPIGVRMVFDASHDLGPVTVLGQIGYQARDTRIGGVTLGTAIAYAF
jgi:hypothetical protein